MKKTFFVTLILVLSMLFSSVALAAGRRCVDIRYYDANGNRVYGSQMYYDNDNIPMFGAGCYYYDQDGNSVSVNGCPIYYYNQDGELYEGTYYYNTYGDAIRPNQTAYYRGGGCCR